MDEIMKLTLSKAEEFIFPNREYKQGELTKFREDFYKTIYEGFFRCSYEILNKNLGLDKKLLSSFNYIKPQLFLMNY